MKKLIFFLLIIPLFAFSQNRPSSGGSSASTITSVFGRIGEITADSADYSSNLITEQTNLFYSEARVSANTDVSSNAAKLTNVEISESSNSVQIGYLSHADPYTVSIGAKAGGNNNPTDRCVFIGYGAGYYYSPYQVSNAVHIGHESGEMSRGDDNVFIGGGSGSYSRGDELTALGADAGASTEGEFGVYIGYESAKYLDGDYCVTIGHQSGKSILIDNQFILQIPTVNATPLISGDFSTGEVIIQKTTTNLFNLTPTTAPATPVNGDMYLSNSDNKIHAYINGAWYSLDITAD